MAKFKSYIGKQVMLDDKIFTFTDVIEEVEDEATIKALSNAQDVEQVKATKTSKDDSDK